MGSFDSSAPDSLCLVGRDGAMANALGFTQHMSSIHVSYK